jgi:hypothetical protein
MSLKIASPIVKTITLDKADALYNNKGEPTAVTVRQAQQGENEERNVLFSRFQREYIGGGVKVTQDIDFDAVRRREVYLTMTGCNITGEDDKPLFAFKDGKLADEETFKKAWAKLPPEYADAIHDAILEVNPQWVNEVGEG